ncbi:MAG: glycoside hydrolase family 31 protein [Ignavibacteriae bacterium]|nr:glycoside hydrolase family 31 protein [Ignavibacteriota bacterium]
MNNRTRPFLLFFLFTFYFCLAPAQWKSIGNVLEATQTDDGVIFFLEGEQVNISVLSPEVIRVRYYPVEYSNNTEYSWAVINSTLGEKNFTTDKLEEKTILKTSKVEVRIEHSPLRIAFFDKKENLLNQDDPKKGMACSGKEIAVWKTMPQDEFYFGLGEKSGSLDRKGKSYVNWNSDIPAYKADTDPLYQTIPFFYGIKKGNAYGIFFDNTYRSYFNFGKEHPDQYSFGAVDGEMNYYFIYGPKPNDVLQKFSALTGTMPMPPKWSIGYQQCRWSYYPESRVMEIAQNFRSKKIPCDVIYLDIHYMDKYKCFTWDNERFPNPKKMTDDLAQDGFKVVTIVDPGIKKEDGYRVYDEGTKGNHFAKYPDGKPFVGTVWPGACVFPDFTKQDSRDWWGSLYKSLVDVGIKGFWNDMNEPSVFDSPNKTFALEVMHDANGTPSDHRKNHNVYGMQMARGTYEGLLKLKPNERPFVLTRAGYAGVQRYSSIWTGDNISNWDHLEMAIPMCLGLSISGQPFIGTDIGGFVGNPSGELFARWMQLGVFNPLMRTHSVIDAMNKEPWEFGPEFEAINKKSIEMRYKFLPYIYTQFYKAATEGTPIMRPLVFDYPEDGNTLWKDDLFMFGDALLVAPVIEERATKRGVYLPAGEWYDYWTNEKISGGKDITVEAPIDKLPLFVKAGSIIPTQQVVQYTDEEPINPLTLEIFPTRKVDSTSQVESTYATTQWYEDDGISFDYQQGKYFTRKATFNQTKENMNVSLTQSKGDYKPPMRTIVMKFNAQSKKPTTVFHDCDELQYSSKEVQPTTALTWSYNSEQKILWVRIPDTFGSQKVIVQY